MGNAHDVSAEADVVVLATWPYQPLLHFRDVRAGHHLTTLGADEPGKVELSADLLQRAHVIVDDLELAATSGALANAGLDAGAAAGTLSDVLQGGLAGRQSEDLVTVYAPIGLPWQDLALTWALYSRAKAREVPSLRAVWLRASTGRQATATPPRTTRRS